MSLSLDTHVAVLFDLDGVLTPTADVHRRAWKRAFDQALRHHLGDDANLFEIDDYLQYVDGKPRYDGVASFLASRGVELPAGDPADPPSLDTRTGIGNLKNREFNAVLAESGVVPYPGSVALIEHLLSRGIEVGVVSSSANARAVLRAAGLIDRFEVIVDGVEAKEHGLAGKPSPATFLYASALLGIDPSEAVVVEDALSGVEAAVAGGFGFVVGVNREDQSDALIAAGANLVVSDLAELVPTGA